MAGIKSKTAVLHERVDVRGARPNVTPLYQSSSFLAGSDYFYTRKSNPNTVELEEVLRKLEGCGHVLTATTGMTAIHLTLALLKPGDHLIVSRLIYGCSFKLFQEFCERYDIALDFADLTDLRRLKSLIKRETKMIFFETPTNPFLRTIDIAEVRAIVRERRSTALIVVDNTWATPYFQRPLELGADLCVYSATKFHSGHSDCMGGAISTDRADLADKLRELRFYSGAILDPHSAWLLRRSMQTFALRMAEHQRVVFEMKRFLETRREVAKVYFPRIDRKQLRGYGCILFFELRAGHASAAREFARALKLFEAGTSMACAVSAVARPYVGSHLSLTPKEKSDMGIKESLVRLCFGFEDTDDLKDDLRQAFRALRRLPRKTK